MVNYLHLTHNPTLHIFYFILFPCLPMPVTSVGTRRMPLSPEIQKLEEIAKTMETNLMSIKRTINDLKRKARDETPDIHPFLVDLSEDDASSNDGDSPFVTVPDISGNLIYVGSKIYCVKKGKYKKRYGRVYKINIYSGLVYFKLEGSRDKTHRASRNLRVVLD